MPLDALLHKLASLQGDQHPQQEQNQMPNGQLSTTLMRLQIHKDICLRLLKVRVPEQHGAQSHATDRKVNVTTVRCLHGTSLPASGFKFAVSCTCLPHWQHHYIPFDAAYSAQACNAQSLYRFICEASCPKKVNASQMAQTGKNAKCRGIAQKCMLSKTEAKC